MKKLITFCCIVLLVISALNTFSQRYLTEVFTSVSVTSDVVYGENYSVLTGAPVMENLLMDVYMPEGDTLLKRPLIILAHAGSFLPKGMNQMPFGNKLDSSMVEMCTQFAKRGWVAVSMDYRLGWNPFAPDQEGKANTIINAVYRSMQDAKACIRFFKKDAAIDNVYGIDPEKITLGGSNSGGYTALAAAYLNKVEEINLPKFLNTADQTSFVNQAVTGGFDGEGGMEGVNYYNHPEHTSNFHLVFCMGGAIGDTSWIDAGEGNMPVIGFHGVVDPTTPYLTDIVIVASTGDPIVEVSGAHDFTLQANDMGLQEDFINANLSDPYTTVAEGLTDIEGLFPFIGAANGFEPWSWYDPDDQWAVGSGSPFNPSATKEKALFYIDTIMGYFCPRAVIAMDLVTSAPIINSSFAKNRINIYPNPAVSAVNIESKTGLISAIEVYNITGQLVRQITEINSTDLKLEKDDLNPGIYFVNIKVNENIYVKKIIFE